jgi:hypothetical protein
VAIALMWSSLEKFAYPDWFYPLVVEKPYLTFGLPRDAFIPMAGVAEFTLGFGLLSTPLIRRGLIMAALVAIAVHDWGEVRLRAPGVLPIPTGLASALVLFAALYWGSHGLIYAPNGVMSVEAPSTHSPDPDHPHEGAALPEASAIQTAQVRP